MPKTRKVLLLIESARGFGRDLLTGIAKYARLHGPWSFYTYAPFFRIVEKNSEILNRLQNEEIHGVISRDTEVSATLKAMNIPVVFASTINQETTELSGHFPVVRTNNSQIGKLAAEHLLLCGFKDFAYCGYIDIGWSQSRFSSFKELLNAKGFEVNQFQNPDREKIQYWEYERSFLSDWLISLPKPAGIMTCCDDRSRDLIEAAKFVNIRVPEDVAIVGVDNDILVCELANPTLSSIALDTVNAGYKAAQLLDELMSSGKAHNNHNIIINPTNVEIRHSTDILAVDDSEVRDAMHFIRENIYRLITVEDVVDGTCLSRRSLERRFNKAYGRSVHDEICRARIDKISKMLCETNMTQLQIAHSFGFDSIDNLRRFFHRETGLTPLKYRRQYQSIYPG